VGASQEKAPITARPQFCPPVPRYRPPHKKTQTSQNKKVFRNAFSVSLPKGSTGQGSSRVPPSNMPSETMTSLAIGQKSATIPRRTTTKSRAIPMHAKDTYTIPP
jgi:hypothetical protein